MTTNARGRHRKLRRNILHTIVATALLSGTFTVVDQSINATPVSAAAPIAPTAANSSVSADGTKISMLFTTDLSANIPAKEQFAVQVGTYAVPATPSVNIPVSSVTFSSPRTITLNLSGVIDSNKAPKVTYTAPAIDNTLNNFAIQDTLGNDGAGFAVSPTTQSLIPALISSTPPTLQAAGNVIKLTYNIALAASPALPPIGAFTVTTGSATNNPVVGISRPTTTTVDLTLRDGVVAGNAVVVSYTAPAVDNALATNLALQGTAGNDAQSFSNVTVTNTASLVPKLNSATNAADGHTIALTFSQTLNTSPLPAVSDFVVKANGSPVSLSSVTVAANSAIVTLTLIGTIETGATITVSYVPPSAWNIATTNVAIQKITTGEDALAFTDFSVTNISSAPYVISTSTNTGGDYIYLNFNEDIEQATIKTLSQFSVKVNGINVSLMDSRVGTGLRQVYVRLSNASIERTDTVTLSYTPVSYSATTTPDGVLQDLAGNDAPALVNFPITNNSTKDTRPPTLQSAVVSTDGLSMQLTASEPITSFTTLSTGWQILVNGVARTVASATMPAAPITSFTFNFSQANRIGAGDVVTVGYTNNAYANKFQDASPSVNQAATFSGLAAVNNSTVDRTSPVLQSIEVPTSGDRLILHYNEALGSTLPAVNTTNFGVTNGGAAWLPTGISVSGSDVILTGPTTIEAGKTVVLTKYTAPASDSLTTNAAIQDSNGNDAISLTNVAVTNNSTVDITSPTWVSATTNAAGDQITLTFNEDISANLAPLANAFTISSSIGSVPTVTTTSTSGRTVVLNLSTPLQIGSTVTFGYSAPNASLLNGSGNAAIQDLAGNDSVTLSNKAVTNISTYDTIGPLLSTLATRSVSANGQTLTLTFNEAIGSTAASASSFLITAAGSPIPVSGVAVSGSTVVLTLGSVIQIGQSVAATYTAPSVDSGTGNSAIQDLLGNDALTFSSQAVTNSSTMDTIAPVFTSASLDAAGTLLTLIYGENPTSAAGSVPSSSQYTVTADGTSVTVTNAVVSGNSIRLTLATAINGGQSVTVSYLAPSPATNTTGNTAVQDATGNDSASLTSASVTNGSTVGPPAFYEFIVQPNGTEIWVVFNKQLTATSPASSLTFFANGTSISCTGNPGQSWYGSLPYWNYQCSPKITAGMTVTATYTKPASGNVYGSAAGATASKSGMAVTNNSTQAPDTTPPTLSSAAINSLGTTLTLTYNETLSAVTASASAFTVTVAGNPVTVTGVSRSGSTILLTLGSVVNATDAVTIAYTAPTPDASGSNGAIQDGSGNDAGSIANTFAVTNSSTQGPLVITGGTVAASGTSVTLTFSKPITSYTMSGAPFTIYANGAPISCSGFTPPTLSGCSPTIPTGAVITASFVPNPSYVYTNGSESLQAASGVSLVNNSTQPADVTAPTLTSITMPGTNGQTIVLTYNETMGGVAPTGDMFTILVDGVASTVSSASVVGQQITLTMSPPIELGQTVSVAYTPPTPSNNWANVAAIQDVYGNDAGAITTTSLPNTSTAVVDRAAPVLQSAATNSTGTQIILTYNETINSNTALPASFAITLNGMTFSPTAVSISGSTVVLNVGTTVVSGESVSVSYTAPTPSGLTTNSAIQDLSGNDAASLTNTTVTNNSNGLPDLTPPAVSTVAYSGTQVTVTLNEPLSSTSAGTSQYTVFVGNTPVTPNSVTVSGQTVVLTLPSSIPAGTIIAVSYTAPLPAVSNTSNQALQDVRGNDATSFNTSTQPTSTSWEWVGGQPTQTCPGSGSAYPNSSKSKLLPNGVTYTVSVTGDYLCIDQATESLSERGGQAGDFQSVGLVTEPGLMMWTSNNGCVANQLIGRCDNRGVMTISFSKPVTNPVVSFAGWGGGSNGAGWSEMQLLGGMNGSSSVPGARFTALAGTNIQISQNGTVVGNVDGTVPAIYCHKTTGYGANAQAVCGSLQLEGVYTSATFQVNFEYAASSTGSDGGNEDAWNLTASIPEDFGMVPTSYDNPVASHALGSLKLGSVVTADNPSSLYSTTNADAVAAGTEIKAGSKNLSNGDVIVDDGVPQSSWSGLVDDRDGQTFTIPVTIAGATETANLCAWIDFNRDGVFTAGERSCASTVAIGQTSANISWTIPNDIVSGPTYARVRISYDSLPLPSGKVGSGEVEDYSLVIASSAIPSANKDDSIAGKDVNQTISPLTNDQFEQGVANDMTKMFLCLPAQTPMNCTIGTGQSLTIPGEGTYTLNANGTVTFDPVPTFTGTATPIKYQIADTSGRTSSSTINPVVIPTPVGVPDTSSGAYDKDQIISPLINDRPGSNNYPIVGSTLKLCQVDNPATSGVNEAQIPNSCTATSVTIPGEGTYTLNSDGTITFNPLPTFYGTVATPVKYQAQDSLGQFENSTITPTVAQPPMASATNDISSDNYDTNQLIRPLDNDSSGSNEQTLLPDTVKLCNPASTPPQTSPNCTLTSLTTSDGTYTVNSDGTVTFNPLPTFTGTVATPVGYQVTDALGRKVSANITPTVGLPPAPSAAPETTTGPYNTAQFTTPLTNETPGSASFPLSQSSLKLCAITEGPNNCSATSVTIPGEGTYTYNATTGRITFTPLATFTGQATPIVYQTNDSLNRFVDSTYTPTVGTPPPPVAVANLSSGNYDQNQTITPLGNDTAGSAAFPISATTIRLCQVDDPATSPTNEAQSPNNCSVGENGTVTIPGEGTYTLNADGTVTFDPLPTFAGTVQTPLKYQVADTRGVVTNSTITPTVYAPDPPSADPETTIGKKGASQTTDLLVGDTTSDPDINLVASSVKLCNPATNEVAPNCTLTTLVVPNVGTYTVVNGVMTFAPLSTYVGTPTPVAYQVTDSMGGKATSTYTPTVIGTPTANPDTTSGAWKANQSINVVNNVTGNTGDDVAANGATLDFTSVKISCAGAANCTETVDGNSVVTAVTIANQGTYTVNTATGVVTFDPLDTFTGQATPVTYTVSDNLGQTATSTYTPTVNPPAPPTADAETTTGSKGVAQTTDLLVGDSTSDPAISLVASSVKLCDPTTNPAQAAPNCTLTSLTVPGVGTYVVVDGVMTFTPDANYVGTPTPVAYQVTDSLGATTGSTYTPTVVGTPTASPNTTTGAKGSPQEVSLVGNDYAATGATLDPTSVKLCDPNPTAEVAPNCTKTSVTVAGVGTYSVDSTGKMTFTPDANYVGTPPALSYTVTDSLGAKASSTYTPTVIGTPTATPDTSTGPQGVAQSRNVVTNTAGTSDAAADGTTLVSSTVTLSCASAPNCTRNIDGTVTIDGQGTYSASAADGTVVFTPLPAFTGTATPVTYTISDALGQSATTTYTPSVTPAPVAINDTSTNGQDKNQLIDVLNNDTVPTNPAGDPLNPATVKLCNPATNPAQTAPNCTLTTLTTADGTYTVDPTTGVVTFDPIPSFTGTVSVPVHYQVSDTGATPQVTSATITPTVIPGPTALNDTSSGPMNTPQTKTLVTNDSAASGATLDVASVKICDPNAPVEVAPNCTKTSVTVPNVGTYAVDSSGVMTFTPVNGYSGTPAPLSYTVEDNFDVKATATYTPTVIPPPTVVPDTSTGPWDTNQTRNVVTNNVNTSDSAATGTTLAAGSVRLCAPTDTAPNCTIDGSGSVVIPNQGTYTLDPATGIVTFDPLPTFKGTATPVTYSVTDALGQKSSTTYTPTVSAPPAPAADPETTSGAKGATQTIDLLPGDTTFDPAITLDPASVKLCGISPAEVMPNCTKSSLTVAGVGTYSVANGVMTFTPEPNYTGTPAPVSYQVTDSLGGKATSTYTPTVIPPPTVVPDTSTGPWDTNQTRNVVTNNVNTSDSAATGTTLAAGSVRLCAPTDTAPNCTVDASGSVVIPNQGTYTLDPATGIVTFDPLPTFTGPATPVSYSITDALGQKSSTTYTPTVTVPPVPAATPDTVELIPGQSKVFSSIFDGQTGDSDPALATKGTGGPNLTNSSVCLLTPGTTTCDADGIVTIPGEGTYTLNPTTGIVTYDALSSATPGVKTPVIYKITDDLGRSVTSTLTPTLTPPPVANPDFSTGVQGAIQTLSPVGNDRPGGGASTELFPDTRVQIPSGVFLCAANQPPPDCAASSVTVTDPVTNATLGVLTVAASGLVTFTPEPNFIGTTPPIGYQIPDNLGQKAYSTITITVVPPPAPSATIDTGSAEYNKPVTLRPWLNDAAGAVPAGSSAPAPSLIATSIKLCDDNNTFVAMSLAPADCTATKVQTVEGIYEVNATTGEVVFTPNPNMVDPVTGLPTGKGFVGTVKYPPTYQIWNNWSGVGGQKSATSLLVPTIAPPGAPAASVDVTKTKPGTSVVLNPVSNDKPGTAALDPTSIRLCGSGEISPACAQMSVTTLDGLYVVNETTGEVTFTPRDGFTGKATIPYIIRDGLGMVANANLIITVEDTAVVPVVKKKTGLAKTGGHRPDLLLLLGILAMVGAGGLRIASRKK